MPASVEKKPLKTVRVVKLDSHGEYVFSWGGQLIGECSGWRRVRAIFGISPHAVGRIMFLPGDMFVETYFTERWYNCFEVHEQESEAVKAWYVNICRPAEFTPEEIRWEDLALDLLVYADGSSELLDVYEFEALELDEATRRKCWQTVEELKERVLAGGAEVLGKA